MKPPGESGPDTPDHHRGELAGQRHGAVGDDLLRGEAVGYNQALDSLNSVYQGIAEALQGGLDQEQSRTKLHAEAIDAARKEIQHSLIPQAPDKATMNIAIEGYENICTQIKAVQNEARGAWDDIVRTMKNIPTKEYDLALGPYSIYTNIQGTSKRQ